MNKLEGKEALSDAGVDASKQKSDGWFYFIAVTMGCGSGLLHITVQDPLLTALAVLASTMLLGFLRPPRPWRWVLSVGLCVPAVMTAANLLRYYKDFSRAGLYGSALIILPGLAGAYGGHFGRTFLTIMFGKKE